MTFLHGIARSFIAPMFLTGGMDAIKHPAAKAPAAAKVTPRLAAMGFPDDPEKLVRVNGGIQFVAGSLLALGRVPRLASAALAASLVPTTLAGHRFWEESDPTKRTAQRTQFLKNLAMLGGLVLAATDTNGAPSLKWRAKRTARRASASISSIQSPFSGHTSTASELGDRMTALGGRASDAATPLLSRAMSMAGTVGSLLSDSAAHVGELVGDSAAHVGEFADRAVTSVSDRASALASAR